MAQFPLPTGNLLVAVSDTSRYVDIKSVFDITLLSASLSYMSQVKFGGAGSSIVSTSQSSPTTCPPTLIANIVSDIRFGLSQLPWNKGSQSPSYSAMLFRISLMSSKSGPKSPSIIAWRLLLIKVTISTLLGRVICPSSIVSTTRKSPSSSVTKQSVVCSTTTDSSEPE